MSDADAWGDALLAADLLAVDPALGGARLRARPGPARDAWLARLKAGLPEGAPMRRVPAHISEERLLGGLDLAATLSLGLPVARAGLLSEADGGVAVLAMAERTGAAVAAHLGTALDSGEIAVERDGVAARIRARLMVVALDEGIGADEFAPAALCERLAFDLPLDGMRPVGRDTRDAISARARLGSVIVPDAMIEALCAAADALGVASPRAAIFAVRAARAAAALAGRGEADADDAARAARLVLGPRATRAPAQDEPDDAPDSGEQPDPGEAPQEGADDGDDAPGEPDLADIVLTAARAALPAGLLNAAGVGGTTRSRGDSSGTAGAMKRAALRGRPVGARPGRPEGGARLDLIETLRAAAPWQPLRRRATGARQGVLIERADFRIKRFRRPAESATIFAVDASGSAAAQRLAEAKGAVELLLAQSYVRRDHVALVAFRGRGAELILPPTRALVRAKRGLAGLPGGGGTPLASGIDLAAAQADAARRRGWTPTLVLLTDGRANVGRNGAGGRAAAQAEALDAARRVRLAGCAAILIDTSPRPGPEAAALAAAMGARYLALPRAQAAAMTNAIREAGG